MNDIQKADREEKKHGAYFTSKTILAGIILTWSASILLALELKTLLTPGNFPIGTDPSFDISVAIFCVMVCVLGGLLLWRGIKEREYRLEPKLEYFLNLATFFTVLLIAVVFVTGALLFSANNAFKVQYKPGLRDEPIPDYSVPAFPAPQAFQPTPTFDPGSKFLAGPVKSTMDGLRVGDIWISMSPDAEIINFIQVYIHRIECDSQQGAVVNIFAIDKSEQLIPGPIPILEDKSFYAGQDTASIHGIAGGIGQAYGTIHLHYIDPADKKRTCDLGSFEWTASLTTNSQ